jgi:hypothetical protein
MKLLLVQYYKESSFNKNLYSRKAELIDCVGSRKESSCFITKDNRALYSPLISRPHCQHRYTYILQHYLSAANTNRHSLSLN